MPRILFLVGLALLALNLEAQAKNTYAYGVRAGLGVSIPFAEKLNETLRGLGSAEVANQYPFATSWGADLNFNGFETDLVAGRASSLLFGSPSGLNRTRLAVDFAELTFGTRWKPWDGVFVTAGLGVGVSQYLVQTYRSDVSTATQVLASTGQGSFVSDWNWSPVVSSRLAWRFYQIPKTNTFFTLGAGVSLSGSFLPFTWKSGDVNVSGLGTPWVASIRPVLWVGLE